MKHSTSGLKHKNGTALLTTIIMLSISLAVIASTTLLIRNYTFSVQRGTYIDKAFYFAESGLRAAILLRNNGGSDQISLSDSKTFFSNGNTIHKGDWGFTTQTFPVSGSTNRLVATGYYNGVQQSVQVLYEDKSTGGKPDKPSGYFDMVLIEGNPHHLLELSSADFINGPVHTQGDLEANGAKLDRSEHDLGDAEGSTESNTLLDEEGETWVEAGNPKVFEGPATQQEYNAQLAFKEEKSDILRIDGKYTPGEAFLDKGNGNYDDGEKYFDKWWKQKNYQNSNPDAKITQKTKNGKRYWFIDEGNGVYDKGESFVDDRNGVYDRGVTAQGTVKGVAGSAGQGELEATGRNESITPPTLENMYYHLPRNDVEDMGGADLNGGHDIKISHTTFGSDKVGKGIAGRTGKDELSRIFVRNPPRRNGKNPVTGVHHSYPNEDTDVVGRINGVRDRLYFAQNYPNEDATDREKWGDKAGQRIVDDYFLEDSFHSTYGNRANSQTVTTTDAYKTAPEFIHIPEEGNNKVYYVDGNLYIHSPTAYAMRFTKPGTKVTIVVNGNITISDEFYYNGTYGNRTVKGTQTPTGSSSVAYSEMNSTIVENPLDNLCLIAKKNKNVEEVLGEGSTGNIYIGDIMAGTGGSIHAMLYAENDFVDNNLNSKNQPFISIFGSMAAGHNIDIERAGDNPTRLDVTLDPRASELPGLPPPSAGDPTQGTPPTWNWDVIKGTWEKVVTAQ